MLLIRCPYCGEKRPELEFRHAGEAHIARPGAIMDTTDEEFAEYIYFRTNVRGLIFERWRHIHGCGRFFNAVRHSVTDKFVATYPAGERKPDLPLEAGYGAGFDANAAGAEAGGPGNGGARTEAQQ